jgi:uncharacterized protein YbjT (DUF2867 family)
VTNVLVLGAGGQIARWVVEDLGTDEDIVLTLFAREERQIRQVPSGARVIEGDVLEASALADAVRGQDIVYANLAGEVDQQARAIVEAMSAEGVERLIFVTALGIYDEVPGAFGQWNKQQIGSVLNTYRSAADVIEESNLTYTLIRPAWLTNDDQVSYEVTQRDEPFKGTEVSRRSVGALIADTIRHPENWQRASLGVDKPGTEGPRPTFM